MLRLSGSLGYHQAGVAEVVEQSGSNLSRFYGTYAGKDECYAAAYGAAAEGLCARLLADCQRSPDWITGCKTALLELAAYTTEDAALATGVISEVHIAGGAALRKRAEVVGRLASAVDRGRAERDILRPPPPAATASFVVQAVDSVVVRCLREKKPVRESLPGLLFLVVASYLGPGAARHAVRGYPAGNVDDLGRPAP